MMFFKYLLTGISSVGIAGASGYTVYYFTSPDPKDRLMKYFPEEEFPKGDFDPDGKGRNYDEEQMGKDDKRIEENVGSEKVEEIKEEKI